MVGGPHASNFRHQLIKTVDVVFVDAGEHVGKTTANHSANNKRTTAPNGSNASCGFACKDNVMKILVTGGAGYVGSHACKALAAKAFEPVAYDNLSRGHRWAVKWGPLEEGDIRDEDRLGEVLDRHQPAAVNAFCRVRLCRRVGRTAALLLRE
jgi:hypothetical protein